MLVSQSSQTNHIFYYLEFFVRLFSTVRNRCESIENRKQNNEKSLNINLCIFSYKQDILINFKDSILLLKLKEQMIDMIYFNWSKYL